MIFQSGTIRTVTTGTNRTDRDNSKPKNGTNQTETTGTNRPKSVAQIEPKYPQLKEYLIQKNNVSQGIETIKSPFTLLEIREKFKYKEYKESLLLEFQISMGNPEVKPMLHEYIPGEIIAWSWVDGRFATQKVYLIEKDRLRKVYAIPKDKEFLNKLNSYVPEKSRFIYDSELWTFPTIKEKLEDGNYLIKVTVKSYNSRPMEPSNDILNYTIEYKTKDFKKFELIRLKDKRAEEWIMVNK